VYRAIPLNKTACGLALQFSLQFRNHTHRLQVYNDVMLKKLRHILHGALGLLQSRMHIGIASLEVIAKRRSICQSCPEALPCKGSIRIKCKCSVCGCQLNDKIRLNSEKCPLGKW
jgi:hypothetical protein